MNWNLYQTFLPPLILLLFSSGCTTNPTEPLIDQSYKIVFDQGNGGHSDIYIMNEDGSDQKKLTNTNEGWSGYPVLSPDKSKIAFTSYRNGNLEIFTMNLDGSDEKQLTNLSEPEQSGHVWSPDGTRLVFRGSDGIYLINSDGTDERQLTNNYEDRFASWSPDGNKIVFSSFRGDSLGFLSSIYIINADGNNLLRLTNDTINARFPLWLHDGNTIAFMRTTENDWFSDIYLINVDGSGLQQISPSELEVTYMAISPDGSRIAFCHYVTLYVIDLFIINIDGTGLQKLNPAGFNLDGLGYVNWSPDGNKLAFSPGYTTDTQRTIDYGIYTIRPDGSNLKFLGAGSNPQLSTKLSQYSSY